MFDFYQKRKIKSVLASRITQGVLLLIGFVVAASALTRYQIAVDMEARRAVVEAEAVALEARKASLEAEVQYLSDPRGIEAEMRRQFDVAKEGEQVVVIVNPEVPPAPEPLATTTEKTPWYVFWR